MALPAIENVKEVGDTDLGDFRLCIWKPAALHLLQVFLCHVCNVLNG
jgi:hypothetical protein